MAPISGGHSLVLQRQDGSAFLRVEIATGKAWASLGLGFNSRNIGRAASQLPEFFAALATASGGRLIPAAGGVLIIDESEVIGAVGISGDSSDADEACAIAGIHHADITPTRPTQLDDRSVGPLTPVSSGLAVQAAVGATRAQLASIAERALRAFPGAE